MSSRVSRTALAAALVVASLSALAQTAPTRSAKLDQALEAIVPTPYAIELDRRVPRDWVVHWTPGSGNWMKVLQEALEPMGLKVEADWGRSVIRVRPSDPSVTTQPQSGSRLKTVDAEPVEWPALATVNSSGWDAAAPKPPSRPMSVGRALATVVPPEFSGLEVEFSGVSANAQVTWSGKSRREALSSIERAVGAKVLLTPRGLLVASETASRTSASLFQSSGQSMATHPVAPRAASYVLEGGRPLKPQLEAWAKAAGWALVWDYPEDWMVPGGADFGSDFQQAIGRVGEALVANGADLKTTIYLGNRTVRVSSKR
jgi:hypothetical protein